LRLLPEKIVRLAHQLAIAGELDLLRARAGAALDLVEQARRVRPSKKASVHERNRNARCSAVMVRLTAHTEANGP
jgi:hypothetical protein